MPDLQVLEPEALEKLPTHLIVVKRRLFTRKAMTIYKRIGNGYAELSKHRVAIGAPGFSTPPGAYLVHRKEAPPTYTAPNKKWAIEAGYEPGQKIPPHDPLNPIRGAFLWLDNTGIGIHGTANTLSLGTKASHGCIRVSEEDAMYLFRTTPLGTPAVIC